MIGLSILLALAVYVWLGKWLVGQVVSKKAKVLIIAVFVLIPTWDVVPSWLYLTYLCETEGGVKIYKSIKGVEGFRDHIGIGRGALENYGYKFIEGTYGGTVLYRDSLDSRGSLVRQKIDKPSSRYAVKYVNHPLPLKIEKGEKIIFDELTGETLAINTIFYLAGNWLQVMMKPLLGGGNSCPAYSWDSPVHRDFFVNTLKPGK